MPSLPRSTTSVARRSTLGCGPSSTSGCRPGGRPARARPGSDRVGRSAAPAIFEQIQHTHDLLWDLDCFHGRQPAAAGRAAPSADQRGTDLPLRTAAAVDLPRHPAGPRPPIAARAPHASIHLYGYAVANRSPGKALADAMALEVREGRARRPERGHYEVTARLPAVATAAVGTAADAAAGRPAAPVVPGAVVARRGRRRPRPTSRAEAQADLAARNPASRSARMSSIDSRPTERRTSPGVTPGRHLLLGGELAVRGRGRVDDQAAHVADVGHVAVQLESVDERAGRPRCRPAISNESTEPAPFGRTSARSSYHGRGRQAGVVRPTRPRRGPRATRRPSGRWRSGAPCAGSASRGPGGTGTR